MKKILAILPFPLMLCSCLGDADVKVTAVIQAFDSGTSRGVILTVTEGGEAICTPAGGFDNVEVPNFDEATGVFFPVAIAGLDDLMVGQYEGGGVTSQDPLAVFDAEVNLTVITATHVSGNFRLLDSLGNVKKSRLSFRAARCPDYVGPR